LGRKGQNVQAQNVASPSKLSPGQSPGLFFIALTAAPPQSSRNHVTQCGDVSLRQMTPFT
jgi:hypothetical protein